MPEFLRRAKTIMTDAERNDLIDFLSANPEAGVSLGGGIRKLRFARDGGGKSGGFRSIHFYAPGRGQPVFLMTVFSKNAKSYLKPDEEAALVSIGERILASYGRKS
ncbi:type II toxin-antitoxin system RelE/ParE family toxin [Pseudotabrizicola sp. 4114]|uniref:type II toxin-antitoxin system RelE/ParE family toxin n=1 Tax=Pseudotabrizicola sp. 4114 TaxID=2817731 RepID=UPI002855BE59|nr:hypothetical protein [Pseudorhodobacter sp. 4114]